MVFLLVRPCYCTLVKDFCYSWRKIIFYYSRLIGLICFSIVLFILWISVYLSVCLFMMLIFLRRNIYISDPILVPSVGILSGISFPTLTSLQICPNLLLSNTHRLYLVALFSRLSAMECQFKLGPTTDIFFLVHEFLSKNRSSEMRCKKTFCISQILGWVS